MRVTLFGAALLLSACAGPIGPMASGGMGGEINAFPGDESEKLLAGLDSAEAGAKRPGDAALGCAQLGQETVAIALDPAVQGVVQRMGGSPQAALAEIKKKQQQQLVEAAAYAALSVLSGLAGQVNGLGMLTSGAQDALGKSMTAREAQQAAEGAKRAADVQTIMPQVMRGRRVQELAEAKSCAFLKAS